MCEYRKHDLYIFFQGIYWYKEVAMLNRHGTSSGTKI